MYKPAVFPEIPDFLQGHNATEAELQAEFSVMAAGRGSAIASRGFLETGGKDTDDQSQGPAGWFTREGTRLPRKRA